jgi:hypothetical protein
MPAPRTAGRIALQVVALASTPAVATSLVCTAITPASAQEAAIEKRDMQIDALDPGIKLFLREEMARDNTRFRDDNIVLFLIGFN